MKDGPVPRAATGSPRKELPRGDKHAALKLVDGRIGLRALVVRMSVDVFGNDDLLSIPKQFHPQTGDRALALTAPGGAAKLLSLEVHERRSVWKR